LLAERQWLVRRCAVGMGARGGLQRLTAGQRTFRRRSTREGERHERTMQPCARQIAERSASGRARGRSVLLTDRQSLVRWCVGGVGARGGLQPLAAGQRAFGRRSTRGASGTAARRSRVRVRPPSDPPRVARGWARLLAERHSLVRRCVGGVGARGGLHRLAAGQRASGRRSARRALGTTYDAAVRASDRRAIRLGASEGALGVARRSSVARATISRWLGRPRRPPAFGGRPEGVRAALHAGGERHGRTTQPRTRPIAERSASGGKGGGLGC
jgi:hypothetical protein